MDRSPEIVIGESEESRFIFRVMVDSCGDKSRVETVASVKKTRKNSPNLESGLK